MQDRSAVEESRTPVGRALTAGATGALLLTGLHEAARRLLAEAPRVDVIGKRALARALTSIGLRPARGRRLFRQTLAAEVLGNTLYYVLVSASSPRRVLRNGLLLGAAAGLGAVVLPPWLGLGRREVRRTPLTSALTVASYTAGGLAAGSLIRLLADEPD
jgi:predicted Zn-dependent protease